MASPELLERFRWLYSGDVQNMDDLRARFDESAVIHQDPNIPGTRGKFHGHAGVQALDLEIRESFDEIEWEPREVHELGDDRFVVLLFARGRGARSGIRFDDGVEVGHVVQLRDGRFVHVRAFIGWEPALQAAGVDSAAG